MAENYRERKLDPYLLSQTKKFVTKRLEVVSMSIKVCQNGDEIVDVLGPLIDDLVDIRRATLGKLSGGDPDSLESFVLRTRG